MALKDAQRQVSILTISGWEIARSDTGKLNGYCHIDLKYEQLLWMSVEHFCYPLLGESAEFLRVRTEAWLGLII